MPAVDPVVRNLTEVRGVVRSENVDVDATELGVAAYVTSIDAWGIYGRVPITATVPGGILTVGDADLRYAPLSHDHDAADIVSGVLDVARLGTGTPSAQTYLDGSGAWSEVQQVRLACKNTSASTITAGTIGPAAANSASTMPAIGCVEEDIAAGDVGHVIALGVIRQIDTQTPGWTINQTLYVGSAGGLTSTRPTATTDRVQNIARVIRVATSTGEILVLGAGRTNDVPNYAATTLLGRGSASGAGPAQEITIGSGLSLSGTTLSSTGGGGGLSDGDYGDVTVSGSGTAITIDDDAVTYAKIQNVSESNRLLGRSSAGAGNVEEITCTSAGRALLDDADADAQRTTLGLGSAATSNTGDFAAAVHTHAATDITSGTLDIARIPTGTTSTTVCIGNDARLSDARTPTSHTHAAADITSGTMATARLGSGTANSTTFLRGDQTWATPAGGGSNEVKFANAGMTGVNVASTTLVDLVSKTLTVAAGDTLEIELVGTISNNSGTTRTYTIEAELGAFGVTCVDGTTVAASATNRAPIKVRAVYSVASTSSAGVVVFSERAAPGAADAGLSIATTTYRHAWHTSASNLTGSQAIKLRCLSSAATATQTFTVHSFIVRQYAQAL
jgi:hypothetical protein